MHLADPIALLLLLLVLGDAIGARHPSGWLALPLLAVDARRGATGRARWAQLPSWLRTVALALLVLGLARPRTNGDVRTTTLHGRNVMFALDISSSMKARDLGSRAGNRLDAAKRVLADFVRRRPDDFQGLVLFAGRAFTQAPLTPDDAVILALLERADIGLLPDGTAIGTALAMAERHLKDLPRGAGVIVLVTDGGNNAGMPDPLTAAAIARALGIRVYAVGVSANTLHGTEAAVDSMGAPASMGEAPSSLTSVEELLLKRIATTSGGRYYRATDDAGLRGAIEDIDRLERTDLHLRQVLTYHEWFWVPVVTACVLFIGAWALRATLLKGVP